MKTKNLLFALIAFLLIGFNPVQSQTFIYGYSNVFEIGGPVYEAPNIFGYSGVFDINTMGEYIAGYSGLFMLNTIGAQITGTVTNYQTGEPIEGAVVKSMVYSSFPTDENGEYTLFVPFGYGYEVTAIAENYHVASVVNINVPQQNPLEEINFTLYPADSYEDFRFAEVLQAPNSYLIEVPKGGIGYAWYVVEGKVGENTWFPVPNATIGVTDGQGNQVLNKDNNPVLSNSLFYSYLNSPQEVENDGVFCVPVKSEIIGNGQVAQQESFTITTVNGQVVSAENQLTFSAKVIPYEFSKNWGFRIYAKGGIGVGAATGIARANAFAGGGSGAVINVKFDDPDNTSDWSAFQVIRKNDIFAGVEASIGPPDLLAVDVGVSAGVTASFPYQTTFDFEMESIDGLEALLAFYIFYEPTIKLAGSVIPGGQLGVGFLSWTTEVLVANSGVNGLSIARESDACGMDIEGHMNFEADFGFSLAKNMKLGMDASVGAHAHFGSFIENHENGLNISNAYIGAGYDANLDVGLKLGDDKKKKSKFMYPVRMKQPYFPTSLEVEYGCTNTDQFGNWQSICLETSIESNWDDMNIYDLPGQRQKYTSSFQVEDLALKDWIDNNTIIAAETGKVGKSATNMVVNRNTYKNDVENLLAKVYDDQENDVPTTLRYEYAGEGRSEYEIDMTVQFPLPVFPALDIVIGGGLQANNTREYDLAEGYWVKGMPYLTYELPQPANPELTFVDVMQELWQNVVEGDLWGELADVIVAQIKNSIIKWFDWDVITQAVILNERGSKIEIRENSIPIGMDSIICRQWDWGEEPTSRLSDADHIDSYKRYVSRLRDLREEAVGMHYGIGGFYRFEPVLENFGDSTYLSIVYPDTAVTGFDETSLSMYWEDSLGIWHPLESYIEPDSNRVSAWIENFATYTLAPTMPSGQYGLITEPDSIPSDGVATALVSSPILLNNDSTQIEESTLFTVETNRGTILTGDSEPTIDGIQVPVSDGKVHFEVHGDSIPTPIYLYANSVNGYAKCEGELILFDTIAPAPPTNLSLMISNASVHLFWDETQEPDIAGYKVYFDSDSIPPYDGIATVWGEPSPVGVGKTDQHQVLGLFNDTTYYFAVTAVDVAGNESDYSMLVEGTPIDLTEQIIPLSVGWSGLSSYLNPLYDNTETIFNNIIDNLTILQSETGMYWPAQNTNTIGAWNTHEGYKIKVANAVELTISGSRETNKTLQLSAGWNLIPVLSECAVDVEALFAGKDLVMVKEVAGWNLYWPDYGINTLGGLQPGKAYFVLMGSAGEIEFPECGGLKNVVVPTLTGFETLSGLAPWPTAQPTTSTHSVAVPAGIAGELFKAGDIIGVFDQQGNCSGLGIWQSETTAITLFGNDPTTEAKDGFAEGEPLQFRLYRPDSGEEFDLEVTFDQSLPNAEAVFATNGLSAISEIKMSATGINQVGTENQIQIIPNPAKDEFLLVFDQDIAAQGLLSIYKLDGQKVGVEPILSKQTKVDISLLPSGVYLLQIEINKSLFTKRLIKN